jgi:hypothetical protein
VKQVCPWCETEIVWDEETGPDEVCPNCLNELGDYRTVEVTLDVPDSEEAEEASRSRDKENRNAALQWYGWEGDEEMKPQRKMERYEQAAERLINSQTEMADCPNCRQMMIHIGEQTVDRSHFDPIMPDWMDEPFMQAPFRVHAFVCPVCFQMSWSLADSDRAALIERLREAIEAGQEDND